MSICGGCPAAETDYCHGDCSFEEAVYKVQACYFDLDKEYTELKEKIDELRTAWIAATNPYNMDGLFKVMSMLQEFLNIEYDEEGNPII